MSTRAFRLVGFLLCACLVVLGGAGLAGEALQSDALLITAIAAGCLFFVVLAVGTVVDWFCWRLGEWRRVDEQEASTGADAS